MRLIDADEVREHQFHGCYTNIHIASKTDAYMLGWNDAINAVVECAPTVDAESLITQHEDIGYERGYRDGYAEATVDAEPVKHGYWISESQTKFEKMFFSSRVFKCSVCGNDLDFDGVNVGRGSANYCPNCGAKMEEEDELS